MFDHFTTLCMKGLTNNISNLVENLEDSASFILKWFANTQMEGHATECHVSLSTDETVITKVDSAEIEKSQSKKKKGVTIDSQLSFEKDINTICGKANTKLNYQLQVYFMTNLFVTIL